MKTKIEIGAKVNSSKFGAGVITSIITKSTGYVTVDYNGNIRKEMAFNLTDENGESMKAKPAKQYHTEESAAKLNAGIDSFQSKMKSALEAELGCNGKSIDEMLRMR